MEGRDNNRKDIPPEIIRQVQVLHDQKPGNDSRIKIHGCNDQTVPELSVPHLFLGKHKSQKGGCAHRTGRADDRTHHRDLGRLEQAVNAKRTGIILQMDSLRPEQNNSPGA